MIKYSVSMITQHMCFFASLCELCVWRLYSYLWLCCSTRVWLNVQFDKDVELIYRGLSITIQDRVLFFKVFIIIDSIDVFNCHFKHGLWIWEFICYCFPSEVPQRSNKRLGRAFRRANIMFSPLVAQAKYGSHIFYRYDCYRWI